MKKFILLYFGLVLIVSFAFAQTSKSNVDFVDPTIGGVGRILQPTRPTSHLPNGMLRVFPMRHDQLDDQIWYFPLTVASYRLFNVFALMPVEGPVNTTIWDRRFEYAEETTTPYYYNTSFEDNKIGVDFAPQMRSGYFKLKFPTKKTHYIRLSTLNDDGRIQVTSKRTITGVENFSGMKAYFYAEVDRDILGSEYKNPDDKRALIVDIGDMPDSISFRYGISFISVEQAKENLKKEIPDWDFEIVKKNAFDEWDKVLSQINVEGGSLAQKRVFYTAFYRSYGRMVDINEYGKYYSGYDHKVHQSEEPFYVDNWIWDTYIALEPLHMILDPKKETEKIRSYIDMYKQGGKMPSFALVYGDWPAMTGNYAASWIADAWSKGLRDFNLEDAYRGVKKNSLQETLLPWRSGPLTSLDSFYHKNGYLPGLAPGEKETVEEVSLPWERRQAVSITLTNSYNDWCIAQLAAALGKPKDRVLFMDRAAYYKNVFREDKGFMWPKDKDGNWIEPYNPKLADRAYFTENNAYIFNWDVKHDFDGLFTLMGGREKAKNKLDNLFREDLGLPKFKFWEILPDHSGIVGQFSMGNEPSLHIPFLYNYLGAPWRTQKRIRMLLDTWFSDDVFGFPGDEDGGAMSAWVVFSMMGFFQVTPGIPIYSIGSPVFNEISIKLPNGKVFRIIAENNSNKNRYIQSAFINEKPLKKAWFTHKMILDGKTIRLTMGEVPNKEWGSDAKDMPPSSIDYKIEDY